MKKRIALALVLALSLISVMTFAVSAETCNHENQGYEWCGNDYHSLMCYDCSASLGGEEPHSVVVRQYDGENHVVECSAYGCNYECYEAHTLYDSENDYGKVQECACGYYVEVEHVHTFVYKVITEPTCGMENGLATDEWCPFCGYIGETTLIASAYMEHSYVNGSCEYCGVLQSNSCEHQNISKYTSLGASGHSLSCATCGEVITTEIHSYYESVEQEATWNKDGVKRYTCFHCQYSYTASYSVPSHECDNVCAYATEEVHRYYCSVCLKTHSTAAHTWDNGKVTKQPTTEENGVRTFTCTICKGTKTETIDYIDLDELLANMTQEEATALYKKIFDKYQTELIKDSEMCKKFLCYFSEVIVPDLTERGLDSLYYDEYYQIYIKMRDKMAVNDSVAYAKGYSDALSAVIDKNPIQGIFQGMWSGVLSFATIVSNGIAIGGISMFGVIMTLLIILAVVFVMRLVFKG